EEGDAALVDLGEKLPARLYDEGQGLGPEQETLLAQQLEDEAAFARLQHPSQVLAARLSRRRLEEHGGPGHDGADGLLYRLGAVRPRLFDLLPAANRLAFERGTGGQREDESSDTAKNAHGTPLATTNSS